MKRFMTSLFILIILVYTAMGTTVAGGEILSAETRTGFLAIGQTDTYTFEGNAGDTVIIRLVGDYFAFDARIDLYDSDFIEETSVTSGSPQVTLENYQLKKTGTYTIVAQEVNGDYGANYRLSFLKIPGPTVSEQDPDGGDILSAETKTGTIDLADTDAYTFTGNAGDTVIIRLVGDYFAFDARIDLYAPDGLKETGITSGSPQVTLENYQLLQTGTYTIVAQEVNGDYGANYGLSFLKIPGPTVSEQDPDGGDILCDETKTGTIDLADTDAYTFTATAGHTVIIRLVGDYFDFDARIDLYAPDGLKETGITSGSPQVTLENYQLLQTGTYTIVAQEVSGDCATDYSLSFTKIPCSSCTDDDGDGYAIEGGACGPVDCDDDDYFVNPGVDEICNDGIDNDCDGLIDGADTDCRFKMDIKVNGSDGAINVVTNETVSVTIELEDGSYTGTNVDIWIGAATPYGPYWYNQVGVWTPSMSPIWYYQQLVDIPETEILNISFNAPGVYTFFIAVDTGSGDNIFDIYTRDHVNVFVTGEITGTTSSDLNSIYKLE